MAKAEKAAKGDKKAKKDKAESGKKDKKADKGAKKEKKAKDAGGAKAEPAAGAAAPAPAPQLQQGFPGAGLYPRVGPFAPPSGGLLGGGSSIYGGHPYLRHTAAGGAGSPLGASGLPSYRPPGALPSPGRYGAPASLLLPPPPAGVDVALGGLTSNAVALAQAYQTRMAALSSVAATLLSKREAMVHQLARLQARMGEVAGAREAIEAETLADVEAILHRLRAAEAAKLATLQKDADTLMSDVAAIDGFYGALTSFQPQAGSHEAAAAAAGGLYDPATALQFMRAYPELCAEADRLSVKPVRAEGADSVSVDDFEREVAARNELAGRYAALVDLVAAKDRIILQLLKEREAASRDTDTARSAFERAAAGRAAAAERQKREEVEHWVHLADRLTGELNDVTDKLMRAQLGGGGGGAGAGAGAAAYEHQHDSAARDLAAAAAASVAASSAALGQRGAALPRLPLGQRTPVGGSSAAGGIALPSGAAASGGSRRGAGGNSDDESVPRRPTAVLPGRPGAPGTAAASDYLQRRLSELPPATQLQAGGPGATTSAFAALPLQPSPAPGADGYASSGAGAPAVRSVPPSPKWGAAAAGGADGGLAGEPADLPSPAGLSAAAAGVGGEPLAGAVQ